MGLVSGFVSPCERATLTVGHDQYVVTAVESTTQQFRQASRDRGRERRYPSLIADVCNSPELTEATTLGSALTD